MACGLSEPGKESQTVVNADSVKLITSGMDLAPALAETDSVAILFYKDPFGGEADRYTRYYTQFNTTTDSVIGLLKANFADTYREDTLRKCRSEGKVFCFVKGKPVQTLYFTHQSEACYHVYFIHTGRYYYLPFQKQLESRLRQLKKLAVEP
jgi:hypothetical protein